MTSYSCLRFPCCLLLALPSSMLIINCCLLSLRLRKLLHPSCRFSAHLVSRPPIPRIIHQHPLFRCKHGHSKLVLSRVRRGSGIPDKTLPCSKSIPPQYLSILSAAWRGYRSLHRLCSLSRWTKYGSDNTFAW